MWIMSSMLFEVMGLRPTPRCFLYLVNYSRMKPEIAVKALPMLVNVGRPAFG